MILPYNTADNWRNKCFHMYHYSFSFSRLDKSVFIFTVYLQSTHTSIIDPTHTHTHTPHFCQPFHHTQLYLPTYLRARKITAPLPKNRSCNAHSTLPPSVPHPFLTPHKSPHKSHPHHWFHHHPLTSHHAHHPHFPPLTLSGWAEKLIFVGGAACVICGDDSSVRE
jgi:hypothetical protein